MSDEKLPWKKAKHDPVAEPGQNEKFKAIRLKGVFGCCEDKKQGENRASGELEFMLQFPPYLFLCMQIVSLIRLCSGRFDFNEVRKDDAIYKLEDDALRQYLSYTLGSDNLKNFVEARKRAIQRKSQSMPLQLGNGQNTRLRRNIKLMRRRLSRDEMGYTDRGRRFDGGGGDWKWDSLIFQFRELTERIERNVTLEERAGGPGGIEIVTDLAPGTWNEHFGELPVLVFLELRLQIISWRKMDLLKLPRENGTGLRKWCGGNYRTRKSTQGQLCGFPLPGNPFTSGDAALLRRLSSRMSPPARLKRDDVFKSLDFEVEAEAEDEDDDGFFYDSDYDE
ncbi:hypothetical protein DFH11DRAFT_1544735 [Phellopilus nigrolimitatus]|nr:hypothetical protein DFH11DRAFT_1544735 [Phellopilus nigrolimitatus]